MYTRTPKCLNLEIIHWLFLVKSTQFSNKYYITILIKFGILNDVMGVKKSPSFKADISIN